MTFRDRREAGRRLARDVLELALDRPVVLALPRGGVPVGAEVAAALRAPLDVLAVRKLGAPGNPELAVGAIAEDGSAIVDRGIAGRVGVTEEILQRTVERESRELQRRVEAYRRDRPPADLAGRTVVIVDDGLATGLTALAAVRAVRRLGGARVVMAAPVGSPEAVQRLRDAADDVVCSAVPADLRGVGAWYDDFAPVDDAEVVRLLTAAGGDRGGGQRRGATGETRSVAIDAAPAVTLHGDLVLPPGRRGLVVFAHGSGSSRLSPRNRAVAATLQDAGFATLLLDLLDEREERDRRNVFDIALLSERVQRAAAWAAGDDATAELPLGLFGASTGAAAALCAAAALGGRVRAVVSRGGRPDLAEDDLPAVTAPTLLIVGSADRDVLALNRQAAARLRCPHELAIVEGATHLFEEPGTLEAVAQLAAAWFGEHLPAGSARRTAARGGAR